MTTYVVRDSAGAVTNVIEWNGISSHDPGEGSTIAEATPELLAQFRPSPGPATPEMMPPEALLSKKLLEGLTITSAGTSSLYGLYAIHDAAQANISTIYASIKGGDGLPGGGATFVYLDMVNGQHSFTETTFVAFAKAVRDYVYALQMAAMQPTPRWPDASVTIP